MKIFFQLPNKIITHQKNSGSLEGLQLVVKRIKVQRFQFFHRILLFKSQETQNGFINFYSSHYFYP